MARADSEGARRKGRDLEIQPGLERIAARFSAN